MSGTIVIVGVGALGSHVTLLLRNIEAPITLVDDDQVEAKNVQAQFHARAGLRKNKALALASLVRLLFGRELAAVPHRLTDGNARKLLEGAALVLDCTDNAAARECIRRHTTALGIPCLHGGLAADGGYAAVLWGENFRIDDGAGAATCEGGEHLSFIATAAALMAQCATHYLKTGEKRGFSVSPTHAHAI